MQATRIGLSSNFDGQDLQLRQDLVRIHCHHKILREYMQRSRLFWLNYLGLLGRMGYRYFLLIRGYINI